MKMAKKLTGWCLTLFVMGVLWMLCPFQVHARDRLTGPTFKYFDSYDKFGYVIKQSEHWKSANQNKMHIGVKSYAQDFIHFIMDTEGYDVRNIKASGKNLMAWYAGKRTDNLCEKDEQDGKPVVKKTYKRHDVYIGLFAKKKGSYRVSFDIVNEAGKIVASKKIKVYADSESPFQDIRLNNKKATLNKRGKYTINSFRFNTSLIKVKVKMTKGYRLKRIVKYESEKHTKIKNGATINIEKCSNVYIVYADKYTGETKKAEIYFR